MIEKYLPDDWDSGYENVWLGVTVENKKYGYPRIDAFRKILAKLRFISAEPLLEGGMNDICLEGIHWLILGGESGAGSRIMKNSWATELFNACEERNVPVWFKQWGGKGANKGGCEIYGREHKQWPLNVVQ